MIETLVSGIFILAMIAVIGGHFLFAYRQAFAWWPTARAITDLTKEEAEKVAFLGRSIASYNACIGLGLVASFGLAAGPQAWVQGATLLFIVLTAAVGASGTKGNLILYARLSPAAVALIALVVSQLLI